MLCLGLTANPCAALFLFGKYVSQLLLRGLDGDFVEGNGKSIFSGSESGLISACPRQNGKLSFVFFFHIPESSQASIVWFSSLFPFVPIWTSVWSSVLHTNLFWAFFFFLAWLGVITVFHFIFINLLHLFAFDLLLVLIVCVCVRKRAGMCACKEERILQLLLFSLPAVSRYTVQSWQQGSLLISDACTWAGMSQQHRQGAPSVPSALWLVTQCPGGRGQVLCEH